VTARTGFGRLQAYGRFVLALPGHLRRPPLPLEEAEAIVRHRLEHRAEALLDVVRRRILAYPRSPYAALLRAARCELADIQRLVGDRGVEGALLELRRAGVYVTFEQYKGRAPLICDGREVPLASDAFDNPELSAFYEGTTSGSTGRPGRFALNLEHMRALRPGLLLGLAANGAYRQPTVIWRGVPPSAGGLSWVLGSLVEGRIVERWLTPVTQAEMNPALVDRLALAGVLSAARLCGVPLPRPERVPLAHPERVAQVVAETIAAHGSCVLRSHMSGLTRVALAARAHRIDLSRALFMGSGEPTTAAKAAPILAAGARFRPTYASSETGGIGLPCAAPVDTTDVHFVADTLALIEWPRELPHGRSVGAFHLTTLLPTAPKILFNVEYDDCGIVEERACGCPLEALGYRRHLREIRSYRKLTGEGVTLAGSDALRILEEVLPARYGGSPVDYQLVEEEDPSGFTRLVLRIDPRIAGVDESDVSRVFIAALTTLGPPAGFTGAMWRQAGTLQVRREPPQVGRGGKHAPLVALGARGGAGPATARAER
jgi:hypothetical protein